ncbi:FAD/NAD(P)-binding domain-containing protein [Xylaria sp. FL0933]|nr:FAD/NAD(P)-binding domain-containing protein [Xylaria sp. FL0933]
MREEGFDVQGFERRDSVGGVWSYSSNTSYTSIVPETMANVSKYTSGFSDFPVPEDWPSYLTGDQVGGFLRAYAEKFNLHQHVRFNTTVRAVLRDEAKSAWNVHIAHRDGQEEVLHFDKIILATGSDSVPVWPRMPGRDKFKGAILHGQNYRTPEQFAGQRVLVVGLGNTACEVSMSLAREASCVYQSYRRGRVIISRYDDKGMPTDLEPWPKVQLRYMLRHRLPRLAMRREKHLVLETMVDDAARELAGKGEEEEEEDIRKPSPRKRRAAEELIRGEWRLLPCPAELVHPAVQDGFFSALASGHVTPVRGFRAFAGADDVLLDDDSRIRVDAVIFCTGYTLDFSIMPELEMDDGCCSRPLKTAGGDYRQPGATVPSKLEEEDIASGAASTTPTTTMNGRLELPRLYQMLFPPRHASSVAVLSWMSAVETSWCVSELASMAVSQLWAADVASRPPTVAIGGGFHPPPQSSSSSTSPPKTRQIRRKPAQLPSAAVMNASIDKYHAWWRRGWARESSARPGLIQPYNFYSFLHEAAGTGMYSHVGHSLSPRNWLLWWKDRELHGWLTKGPASSHAWRIFETNPEGIPGCGRRVWPEARRAVRDAFEHCERWKQVGAEKGGISSQTVE